MIRQLRLLLLRLRVLIPTLFRTHGVTVIIWSLTAGFIMIRLGHESFVSTFLGESDDNINSMHNRAGGPSLPKFVYLNGLHIPPRKSLFQQSRNPGPVNSAPGVTGPGIPAAIKKVIQSTQVPIEEDATNFYAAEAAVNALEEKCKWLPEETNFADKSCFDSVKFDPSRSALSYFADPSLIDIVTPSIRNLDFLNQWRQFFQGFHIIIIQDGDPTTHLTIPDWVDYELYNRHDIVNATGEDHSWVISSKDASIRNFGFLVSKKPYIYTIDDDCLPAKDNDGNVINPLAMHLRNLQTPSHPYFFNTLYDPYATGSDFVRGYPYSLRGGVPTAISHGLWLFTPDYDAPTQLLKPKERNTNYLDMAQTIPHRVFYPMCSMNVAFSRELIGPAFMQGLMGDGQPWARYDDMFAGWASKVVADHLGVGVKSGKPYIYHNKLSNPFINLKKEYKGLEWQEDMIRFFANDVRLSKQANTPIKAYVELANLIKTRFRKTNPYFERMGESMIIWTQLWQAVGSGEIKPVPSRVSDASVKKNFLPINLFPTSSSEEEMLTHEEIKTMFPKLGNNAKATVTANDVSIGHRFKTYIFPVDPKFHEGSLNEYLKAKDGYKPGMDCLLNACAGDDIKLGGRGYTDYSAEVIILKKLLGSLHFVKNIKDADLILVPVLHVTTIQYPIGCRSFGKCKNAWYSELANLLKEKSDPTKKHLFLSSQDFQQNHPFYKSMHQAGNIIVSYGPRGLVIPSLNSDSALQPKNWKGCRPLSERQNFLLANMGTRPWLTDRNTINEQLNGYKGNKKVPRLAPGGRDAQNIMMDVQMVLSLPGDLPYQKRFYDVLLHCTIPVVIKRNVNGVGDTYWSNVNYGGETPPRIVDAYPHLDFPYSELVVEVDGLEMQAEGIMTILERIPIEELEKKLEKIEEVRTQFLYDFEGNTHDAFSVMLETLWHKYLSK